MRLATENRHYGTGSKTHFRIEFASEVTNLLSTLSARRGFEFGGGGESPEAFDSVTMGVQRCRFLVSDGDHPLDFPANFPS